VILLLTWNLKEIYMQHERHFSLPKRKYGNKLEKATADPQTHMNDYHWLVGVATIQRRLIRIISHSRQRNICICLSYFYWIRSQYRSQAKCMGKPILSITARWHSAPSTDSLVMYLFVVCIIYWDAFRLGNPVPPTMQENEIPLLFFGRLIWCKEFYRAS